MTAAVPQRATFERVNWWKIRLRSILVGILARRHRRGELMAAGGFGSR